MPTNTDLNIPKFIVRNDKLLFGIYGIASILCFCAAIYFKFYLLFALPFTALFLLLTLLNFKSVFFLMLLTLPVSVESYIGSFGTDLPSEPMVIILAACTILYLIYYKEEWQRNALRHPIFLLIMLLFLWSIFVTIFSTNVFLSVKYLLAKAWYLLGFLILPIILLKDKKNIKTFFWCLFIPTFFSVIYVITRHGLMKFTFDSITESVQPIYRNHVNYAVFITMLLPYIFLAKTWYPSNAWKHTLLKYSILLFLSAIYFSYTRGAWLAVVAMAAFYVVLRFNLTKYFLMVTAMATIVFSIYLIKDNNYLKYAPNYEHTIYHDELAEHLTSTFEMEDMSTVERFYRWIAAVNLFKQHPMVGVGPNNFTANYKPYTVTSYETYISDNEEKSTVHNYFLLLLTEQGIPALLLYIILLVTIFLTAQRVYNISSEENRKYIIAITLCIVSFLFNNTLSDLVEANKVGSLFFISLALLINFSSREISLKDKNR
jgi:O-antigen ligase